MSPFRWHTRVRRFTPIAVVATLIVGASPLGAQVAPKKPLVTPLTAPVAAPVVKTPIVQKAPAVLILAAPTGVSVRLDATSLAFSWQAVGGASGYQIDVSPQPTGPWTPLTQTPINATQFVHTAPVANVLSYYRFSAARALAVSGTSTIVPYFFHGPVGPLGVSAVQQGADVTVSWAPVAGASGYTVRGYWGTIASATLQAAAAATSVTFVGLGNQATALTSGAFDVRADSPIPPPALSRLWGTSLLLGRPTRCGPSAGANPGGSVTSITAPVVGSVGLKLSWPKSGQALAYRVERSAAGSGTWVQVGCVPALPTSTIEDMSIALKPSTSYQYRVTGVEPGSVAGTYVTGTYVTGTTMTTVTTAPPESFVVGVTLHNVGTSRGIQLSWPPASTLVKYYYITSSYGYSSLELGSYHDVIPVPSGTHTFTVTALYANGAPAGLTTVTAVVP